MLRIDGHHLAQVLEQLHRRNEPFSSLVKVPANTVS